MDERAAVERMDAVVPVDWAVGSVPLVGGLLDVTFRTHRRNRDLAAGAPDDPPPADDCPGGSETDYAVAV